MANAKLLRNPMNAMIESLYKQKLALEDKELSMEICISKDFTERRAFFQIIANEEKEYIEKLGNEALQDQRMKRENQENVIKELLNSKFLKKSQIQESVSDYFALISKDSSTPKFAREIQSILNEMEEYENTLTVLTDEVQSSLNLSKRNNQKIENLDDLNMRLEKCLTNRFVKQLLVTNTVGITNEDDDTSTGQPIIEYLIGSLFLYQREYMEMKAEEEAELSREEEERKQLLLSSTKGEEDGSIKGLNIYNFQYNASVVNEIIVQMKTYSKERMLKFNLGNNYENLVRSCDENIKHPMFSLVKHFSNVSSLSPIALIKEVNSLIKHLSHFIIDNAARSDDLKLVVYKLFDDITQFVDEIYVDDISKSFNDSTSGVSFIFFGLKQLMNELTKGGNITQQIFKRFKYYLYEQSTLLCAPDGIDFCIQYKTQELLEASKAKTSSSSPGKSNNTHEILKEVLSKKNKSMMCLFATLLAIDGNGLFLVSDGWNWIVRACKFLDFYRMKSLSTTEPSEKMKYNTNTMIFLVYISQFLRIAGANVFQHYGDTFQNLIRKLQQFLTAASADDTFWKSADPNADPDDTFSADSATNSSAREIMREAGIKAAVEELTQWIKIFLKDSREVPIWTWKGYYPHILSSILTCDFDDQLVEFNNFDKLKIKDKKEANMSWVEKLKAYDLNIGRFNVIDAVDANQRAVARDLHKLMTDIMKKESANDFAFARFCVYKVVTAIICDCTQQDTIELKIEVSTRKLTRIACLLCAIDNTSRAGQNLKLGLQQQFRLQFHKFCPLVIPWFPNDKEASSDVLEAMAFKKLPSGAMESRMTWIDRMNKTFILFVQMTIEKEQVIFTIEDAWAWLANCVNFIKRSGPRNFVLMLDTLDIFLRITATHLFQRYGPSYLQVLRAMRDEIVQKIPSESDSKKAVMAFLDTAIGSNCNTFLAYYTVKKSLDGK